MRPSRPKRLQSRLSSHEITTAITAVQEKGLPGFGGTAEIMKEIIGRSLGRQLCAIPVAGNPGTYGFVRFWRD